MLDIETGSKKLLTPPYGSNQVFNGSYAFFGKDGKGVYFITDRDSEFHRLAYLDFASNRCRFLTDHIKWDIDEFGA